MSVSLQLLDVVEYHAEHFVPFIRPSLEVIVLFNFTSHGAGKKRLFSSPFTDSFVVPLFLQWYVINFSRLHCAVISLLEVLLLVALRLFYLNFYFNMLIFVYHNHVSAVGQSILYTWLWSRIYLHWWAQLGGQVVIGGGYFCHTELKEWTLDSLLAHTRSAWTYWSVESRQSLVSSIQSFFEYGGLVTFQQNGDMISLLPYKVCHLKGPEWDCISYRPITHFSVHSRIFAYVLSVTFNQQRINYKVALLKFNACNMSTLA